ncbi:MAG: DUF4129 domain-containing protein [Gaiellaceae bacterium]
MSERVERRVRAGAVAAGLVALLALVALASGRGRPEARGTTDTGAVADVRDIVLTLGATLYVLAFAAIAWAFWRHRSEGGRFDRPSSAMSLIGFLFLAGALYWGIRNRPEPQVPEQPELGIAPEAQPVAPEEEIREPAKPLRPADFRAEIAAAVLAAAAVAAAAAFAVRRRRGVAELDEVSKRELTVADLMAVVEGTLDDLRREADPRRAVIAAYAQMERVLARHGLPREPSEAPFEYLGRMLRELEVRAGSALALTELFERARFSDHVIDAAMKDEAIDALAAVRDDLRAAS